MKPDKIPKGDGLDRCQACGSASLWDAFFNRKGFAVTDPTPADKWKTVCNDCGTFQKPRKVKG